MPAPLPITNTHSASPAQCGRAIRTRAPVNIARRGEVAAALATFTRRSTGAAPAGAGAAWTRVRIPYVGAAWTSRDLVVSAEGADTARRVRLRCSLADA